MMEVPVSTAGTWPTHLEPPYAHMNVLGERPAGVGLSAIVEDF